MACLGGTHDEPRDWMQRRADGSEQRQHGRLCARFVPGTTPRHMKRQYVFRDTVPDLCSSCPAYRGLDRDGSTRHIGLDAEDGWTALSMDEYRSWQAAEEAAADDDFAPMGALLDRMHGERRRRDVPAWLREDGEGNPEAAEHMREWRRNNPERYRAYMREYMRARRGTKRPRVGELLVPTRTEPETSVFHDTQSAVTAAENQPSHPRARPREGTVGTNNLEEAPE